MKIKIVTDRRPWANGQAQPYGAVIDVSPEDAKTLIGAGFAEEVKRGKSDG